MSQARRSGGWFLRHRNVIRLALLVLVVGFVLWGALGTSGAATGWVTGAGGIGIAIAMAWGVMEILWFLIDRATPDPVGSADDEGPPRP